MGKQRKDFITKYRGSIESRTHHVFQALLKTRNFEVGVSFISYLCPSDDDFVLF